MGRDSLIKMGRLSFEVLLRAKKKRNIEIASELGVKRQVVSNIKRDLIDSFWMEEDGTITKSGEYMIKTIYLNKKCREKLK